MNLPSVCNWQDGEASGLSYSVLAGAGVAIFTTAHFFVLRVAAEGFFLCFSNGLLNFVSFPRILGFGCRLAFA